MDSPKNQSIGVVVSIVIVAVILAYGIYSMRQNGTQTTLGSLTGTSTINTMDNATTTKLASGLEITILNSGTGAEAKNGQVVTVNYVGTLADGTKFDSSYDRHQPFNFTLGTGQVIKGWDEGVVGMKIGEKRKLVIPPTLGYGEHGIGPIPANATLIFEVELVAVH